MDDIIRHIYLLYGAGFKLKNSKIHSDKDGKIKSMFISNGKIKVIWNE